MEWLILIALIVFSENICKDFDWKYFEANKSYHWYISSLPTVSQCSGNVSFEIQQSNRQSAIDNRKSTIARDLQRFPLNYKRYISNNEVFQRFAISFENRQQSIGFFMSNHFLSCQSKWCEMIALVFIQEINHFQRFR